MANAPKFDPNKPYTVGGKAPKSKGQGAPAFDPNKPFKEGGGTNIEASLPMEALKKVSEFTDILDLPRAAVASYLMKGEEGLTEFADKTALAHQKMMEEKQPPSYAFTRDPEISGKEIAHEKLGLSKEETIPLPFTEEKVSPAGLAALPVDIATDPQTYFSPASALLKKPIQKALAKRGAKQASKAVSKFITAAKMAKEGVDPNIIGHQLYSEDVLKYITNPNKLYRKLGKEPAMDVIESGGKIAYKKKLQGSGYIGEAVEDLTDFTTQMTKELGSEAIAPRESLAYRVSSRIITPMVTEGTAEVYDPKLMDKIMGMVNGIVMKPNSKKVLTLSDLLDLKREVGKQLKSKTYYAMESDAVPLLKEVHLNLGREIDDMIVGALDGVKTNWKGVAVDNAADYYKVSNTRASSMIKLKEVLESTDLKNIQAKDIYQFLAEGAAWVGGGALVGPAIGTPMHGAMIGGTFHTLRETGKFVSKKTPEVMARGFKAAEKATPLMLRGVPTMQRTMRGDYGMEERKYPDQSMMTPTQSLPEQLMNQEIPRSTEAVMENPNLFLAKVAQQTDNQDLVIQLGEAMKHPRKLEKFLPLIARQYPNLFEFDEYGAWDRKLIDPADRQLYTKDIMKRDDLNEYQKAEVIDHLNKTHEMLV